MRHVLSSLVLCVSLAATASADPVLYDFYADWCGPCQSMTATVDRLIAEGYAVQRVNIDREPKLAAQFGVQTIPCFVWVESGREVDRVVGVVSVERLRVHGRPRVVEKERVKVKVVPRPAWRYERPEGYRASVVRVFCEDSAGRSIGSGTLVRWNGRTVVLTARHVVRVAVKITVLLCTGKTHEAKVLKMDPTWDCAVLEIMGNPVGTAAARIEFGPSASQRDGDRLESCGYGADGRLAVNTGLFRGYRRSTAAPGGPDDWMVISGHARPGDSGGPVFNGRGRLVGVLWGTDGEEVVCVQAGRLHLVLEAAVPAHAYQPQAYECLDRHPTPPMAEPADAEQEIVAAGCQPPIVAAGCQPAPLASQQPALPWRKGIEAREKATAGAVRDLGGKLDAIAARPAPSSPSPQADARVDEALRLGQEANAKLDALAAQLTQTNSPRANATEQSETLRERIRGKAEEVKDKVDGVLESPFAKHLAAIIGVVFLAGIGLWIAISQHRKAGTKTLAEKGTDLLATATAGTPIGTVTSLLDRAVDGLGQRLRDLDAKMDAKFQSVQHQVTQTALATPAPSQTAAAASSQPAAQA